MPRFNITDPSDVSALISEIESQENVDRKKREWQNYQIYAGNQRYYVENSLKDLYPESHAQMIVSNVNIHGKVTNKKAKVYKKPPIRTISNEPNENLDMVYGQGKFDKSFQLMDVVFNRHRYNLGWVWNDPIIKTEFKLKILAPYLFDVIINPDTGELETVILSYPDGNITGFSDKNDGVDQKIMESANDAGVETKTYTMWSKEFHAAWIVKTHKDEKGKMVSELKLVEDPENPDLKNPLGKLPFEWLSQDWDVPDKPVENSLPLESVWINILNSDLLTGASRASLGMLTIKYPAGSEVKQLFTGHSVSLELPQSTEEGAPPTEADFINPSPDLEGIKGVVYDYASSIMADHGLDGVSLAGSEKNFTSGFDRMLAMADVTEVREENAQRYEEFEQGIFEIIKKFDEVNGTGLFKLEDQLEVHYVKPKPLQSEMDILTAFKLKRELNAAKEHTVIQELNPNLSEDQAIEMLEEIKEDKLANAKQFGLSLGVDDGQVQEPDQEEQDRS